MKPLFRDKSPFENPPRVKEKIQWMQPKLVCKVEYAELTADDQLRQTTFLGWRDDKKAKEIVLRILKGRIRLSDRRTDIIALDAFR
jgi:bifunctional non-homologous end joining protein LigD